MRSGRGGKRKGAGRPKGRSGTRRIKASFTLPPQKIARVRRHPLPISRQIERALDIVWALEDKVNDKDSSKVAGS